MVSSSQTGGERHDFYSRCPLRTDHGHLYSWILLLASRRWMTCRIAYSYNTSIYSSTRKTPYEVVYGPSLLTCIYTRHFTCRSCELRIVGQRWADNAWRSSMTLKEVKEKNSMLAILFIYASNPIGKLSLASRNHKPSPRDYGQLEVAERIGSIAYMSKLPAHHKIQPLFHVPWLKKRIRANVEVQEELPVMIANKRVLTVVLH